MIKLVNAPEFLTSREIADVLDVDISTVNRWTRQGRLPSRRTPGGTRRYATSEVQTVLNGLRLRAPSPRRRELLVKVCDICCGDQGVTCPECDGACVSMAGLLCPKCAGIGEVTPEHCCGCGMTADGGACACPPDE